MTAGKDGPCLPSSEAALFRYLVVSQILSLEGRGSSRTAAAEQVSSLVHRTFAGEGVVRSTRTVLRWVAAWSREGMAGLEPAARRRTAGSMVLPEEFLEFLADQKRADLRVSVPEVIRRAVELGLVGSEPQPDRTTVWRACRRMGLPTRRRKAARDRDSRRFSYPHRMDMLLCDGNHFRAGVERVKRVALFFLDDCSRFGLDVVVGTSESTALFLRGLYRAVGAGGLFSILYVDRGPGFIADDTAEAVRLLEALLIHGQARYPEGHGKIERFNRTANDQVLRGLDRRPDVDADCGALELRLRHWLHRRYNHHPHESLDGGTPAGRFAADTRPLRFPADDADLRRRFVVHVERRVSNDHVVSFEGTRYEVPRGHAGTKVRLHRQLLEERLYMLHQGRMVRLHPVDLAGNAAARRAGDVAPDDADGHARPPGAADLAFQRDFRPVVGADGGFTDPDRQED